MADTPLIYGNYSSFMFPIIPDGEETVTHNTLGKEKISSEKILNEIIKISKEAIEGGYKKTTPVAVVYRASRKDQKIIIGTLTDIASKVKAERPKQDRIHLTRHTPLMQNLAAPRTPNFNVDFGILATV